MARRKPADELVAKLLFTENERRKLMKNTFYAKAEILKSVDYFIESKTKDYKYEIDRLTEKLETEKPKYFEQYPEATEKDFNNSYDWIVKDLEEKKLLSAVAEDLRNELPKLAQ